MDSLPDTMIKPYGKLKEVILAHSPMAVAYSGGVDSAFLACAAREILGDNMICVIAFSPSLARKEYGEAVGFLEQRGIPYERIDTRELENEQYSGNTPDRCYFCKNELFTTMRESLSVDRFPVLAYGANLDDRQDYRPGARAAGEHNVIAPLAEAGFTKQMIRESARALGLELWDKPAAPCLASRIPYNSPVTTEKLKQVELAEQALKDAGFHTCRVRHHDGIARIEVPAGDHKRLFEPSLWPQIVRKILNTGFDKVEVEMDGFRSGRLNDAIETQSEG